MRAVRKGGGAALHKEDTAFFLEGMQPYKHFYYSITESVAGMKFNSYFHPATLGWKLEGHG